MQQFFSEEWMFLTGIFLSLLVSVVCQLILIRYMLQLVKASEKLEEEKHKVLRKWIEEYLQDRQRITNLMIFIEKKSEELTIGGHRVIRIKHLSGQTLLLAVFLAGVGACKGIIEGKTLGQILPFYIICLFGMYLHFSLSSIMDLEGRKKTIQRNIFDFLQNGKTGLYTVMEPEEKGIETQKEFFGEEEDKELKELLREILV